jgi:hypothetical protein
MMWCRRGLGLRLWLCLLVALIPARVSAAATVPAPAKPSMPTAPIVPPVPLRSPGGSVAPGPLLDSLLPTFSWDAVPGALSYAITINQVGTNATVYKNMQVSSTSVSVPAGTLAWGARYWWAVLARTSQGLTDRPQMFYFQTPALTSKPSQAAAIAPGASSGQGPILGTTAPIVFRWNRAALADDYTLVISDITAGMPGNAVYSKSGITDTTLTIPPGALGRGARYTWTVMAANRLGFGPEGRLYFQLPFTAAAGTPTGPPAAPVARTPGDESADGQYVNTLTPTLTWADVAGADSYAVTVKHCASGKVVFENRQVRGLTVMLPSNAITYEQKYCWQVAAANAAGVSPSSKVLRFQGPIFAGGQLSGPSPLPKSPGSGAAPGPTIDTLTPALAWEAVPNANLYQVTVTEMATGRPVLQAYPVSGLSTTLGPILAAGKQYAWTVQAVQQLGAGGRVEGPLSKPLFFQVANTVRPRLPELLGPGTPTAPGEILTTASPTFQWKMVKDIFSFQVHVVDVTAGSAPAVENAVYTADVREVWRYHNGQPDKPVLSHTVPVGRLQPGRRYAWHVGGVLVNNAPIGSEFRYFQVK